MRDIRRLRMRSLVAGVACALLVAFCMRCLGGGGRGRRSDDLQADVVAPESSDAPVSRAVGTAPALESLGRDGVGEITTHHTGDDVAAAAAALLDGYAGDGGCLLASAGYLDLIGRVWGCTIEGVDWVDVCVVRSSGEGDGCVVTVVRMDAPEGEGEAPT